MSGTIFVNHEPGTYKAYRTVGGWVVMFLDERGNSRNIDGGKVHIHKQAAYRKARRLNERLIATKQETPDAQYIASVHDALMEAGKDISLSHVLDYIEHDESRPRDYAIYEVKAIKEQIAAQK